MGWLGLVLSVKSVDGRRLEGDRKVSRLWIAQWMRLSLKARRKRDAGIKVGWP